MIRYTTRYVNILSLFITILIFILFNKNNISFCKDNFNPQTISNLLKRNQIHVEMSASSINLETEEKEIEKLKNKNQEEDKRKYEWKVEIPCIDLIAEISEGTSKELMDKYVGHFEETSKTTGNIGLAAHNRGYKVNYFANIKKLKEGDEIIYKYYDFERKYIVAKNIIIKDTDWSELQDTKDLENTEDKITLITCVENEPEYRRCIQGIYKK